jgi:hypothetical protein
VTAPSWIAVAAILLSPFIAAFLSGYWLHRWKGRVDHLEKRFDEFCECINKTADLAADYWLADATTKKQEAEILAGLSRIAGMRVMLGPVISAAATNELSAAESIFLRQTTGGNFGVHNRTSDINRAMACIHQGAHFVTTVRTARLRDLRGMWQRP